jgi:hypothetical protein
MVDVADIEEVGFVVDEEVELVLAGARVVVGDGTLVPLTGATLDVNVRNRNLEGWQVFRPLPVVIA